MKTAIAVLRYVCDADLASCDESVTDLDYSIRDKEKMLVE